MAEPDDVQHDGIIEVDGSPQHEPGDECGRERSTPIYLLRYRERGNAEPFVTFMERMFDITVGAAEAKRNESHNRMGEVVFLSSGEFLEDALLRMQGV